MVNHAKQQFIDTASREPLATITGLICVDREYRGGLTTFPIEPQRNYKEWQGCYSLLHTPLRNV